MSERKAPPEVKRESSLGMLLTLSAISLLSGLLIVTAVQATLEPIRINKEKMVKKSITQLFPEHKDSKKYTYAEVSAESLESELATSVFYTVYNSSDELLGVAVEASGMGFQDILKIIYGYNIQSKSITGMVVLESKETPGLGDKIEKDERFIANFKKLPVDFNLKPTPFLMVKKNEKSKPHQIEAITGATISSRAITKILNASAPIHLKLIEKNLEKLAGAGK